MKSAGARLGFAALLMVSGVLGLSATMDSARAQGSDPLPIAVESCQLGPSGAIDESTCMTHGAEDPVVIVIWTEGGNRAASYVFIRGKTLPFGDGPVRFAVEGAAAAISGTLAVDERGGFQGRTFAPLDAGDFVIDFTAPDGEGRTSLKVTAIELPELEKRLVHSFHDGDQATDDAIEAARHILVDLPPSPPKDEALKKLPSRPDITHQIHGGPDPDAMPKTITIPVQIIKDEPRLAPTARESMQRIAEDLVRLKRETARVRDLTSRAGSADVGCQQVAFASEIFKAASALLNVKMSILRTAIGLSKDLIADVTSNAAKKGGASDTGGFLGGQIVKNLPDFAPSVVTSVSSKGAEAVTRISAVQNVAKNAPGVLADLGAYISDKTFGAYCNQFTGPIEATMSARFTDPAPWWAYSFKLTGRVVLVYPKSAKGRSIQLHGRIEGFAHSFDTREEALSRLYPGLMTGAIQKKWNFPPLGAAAAQIATQGAAGGISPYLEGSGAAMLMPNAFMISVTGVLEDDKVTLLIGEKKADFSAKHNVITVVLSPLALSHGVRPIHYELPFQGAYHVFQRVSQGQAMTLPLKRSGDTMVAQGQFSAKGGSGGSHGEYTATVKACNPGC